MKSRITLIAILLTFAISSCDNDEAGPIPVIDGLSLYWDHEVFGVEGRRLRFEFNTINQFVNQYKLVFNYSIIGNSITARLVKSTYNGKCQYYPMPSIGTNDSDKCNATGGFYLPDDELANGIYTFNIITPYFKVISEITITDEIVTLEVPVTDHLTSPIHDVYPIPEDILFGSLVYQGSDNGQDAEDFLNDMTALGLTEITLPNFPYRHLSLDENGQAIETFWEPDNHLIGFLYKMNNDFDTVLEPSKKRFNETNLNIYLYTSNGDQGLMTQGDGVTVVYGKN
jgi:hypothetical protein